jgi:hypothetical protein
MPVEYLTLAAERRAVEVLRSLAGHGQHRAPSIPDLLIAAAAETVRLTVLHVDKDFELIAGVTGQEIHRLQWRLPKRSLSRLSYLVRNWLRTSDPSLVRRNRTVARRRRASLGVCSR